MLLIIMPWPVVDLSQATQDLRFSPLLFYSEYWDMSKGTNKVVKFSIIATKWGKSSNNQAKEDKEKGKRKRRKRRNRRLVKKK